MPHVSLPAIEYGYIPNILLIGNGINQAYGEASWDKVLETLSTGEYDYNDVVFSKIKKLPYSLQTILISSDSVDAGMHDIAERMLPREISTSHSDILQSFVNIGFDAILTTNYSYEIETALYYGFDVSIGKASKYRRSSRVGTKPQEQFGIFKYNCVDDHNVWHIHGEAAHPNSMVMGHYYYGKLLAEIQKRVPDVIRSYSACTKNKTSYSPQSWIDYFLIGNIYMVGFGLNPSEMDIWWLINCKKRHFNEGKIFFYEPNLDDSAHYPVRALAETFDIEYDVFHVKDNYIEYYKGVLADVRERMR